MKEDSVKMRVTKNIYYNVIEIMINNSNKVVEYLNSISVFYTSVFYVCFIRGTMA